MNTSLRNRQSGVVLIITMWTIVLLSLLVLVMASDTRLSAELSRSQIDRTSDWVDTLSAFNAAEMELLLETMPEPPEDTDPEDDDDIKDPIFRFNGEALALEYPYPDTVEVRIYDHAGKINLRNLTEDQLRLILEHMMGEEDVDDDEIALLLAAWGDWLDEDDGIRVDGAEEEYYQSLDPPYLPRQGQFETVEELLLIRGFDAMFGDVNLEAAFTLYSDSDLVNINTASREALSLLPGLNEESIDGIIAYRKEQDFTDFFELEDIVPEDELAELQSWVDFTSVSPIYTILVVPKQEWPADEAGDEDDDPDQEEAAEPEQPTFGGISKVVRISDYTERPFVLRVDPLVRLPLLN